MHRVNLENTGLFTDKFLNLTSFTVLTGINSSGKTTILKAIENQFDNVKHYKWTRLSIFTEHLEGEKGDILLFEQPEAGLHPKLQFKLTDILLTYAQTGRRVVVETHSDHFINRIVRRYMEDEKIRKYIKIYFIDQGLYNMSNIEPVVIDEVEGVICENENFFYQFANETSKIIDAGYKNLQKG